MADLGFGPATEPTEPHGDWRADRCRSALAHGAIFQRRSWLARLPIAGPPRGPNAIIWMDARPVLPIWIGRPRSASSRWSAATVPASIRIGRSTRSGRPRSRSRTNAGRAEQRPRPRRSDAVSGWRKAIRRRYPGGVARGSGRGFHLRPRTRPRRRRRRARPGAPAKLKTNQLVHMKARRRVFSLQLLRVGPKCVPRKVAGIADAAVPIAQSVR
jgi:hypothetical protein